MEREEKIGKASRMIYIYMQLRFVIASSEEKTARGPTLCTFTGVSHSVVGVSHLAAGFPLSPLSHLIRTRRLLRRLLKWRSPPPPLLSTPYLRGKGPGAVLSFPKAETQPSNPESRESRSSNSNSATNYRLSPPLSLHHLLRHISRSYYHLESERKNHHRACLEAVVSLGAIDRDCVD